ncbi:hypothetical protein KKG41_00900 [Patescibacteria group bacterium]|nr:hypothetical protein [Patescibacteria group bacterium]MBU1889998.1 hypothetical protein [Patescibacteria group bacterium]
MTKQDLEKIVNYIVSQGLKAIKDNTDVEGLPVDYMGIFAEDDGEFMEIDEVLKTLGVLGDKTATPSGSTYLLNEPLNTPAGPLKVIKIRKPDPTRPQRGAPDFRVSDYSKFKEKYLASCGNFSLMIRPKYEMMELKGINVLVYFPSKSFNDRQTIIN